MDEQHKCNMVVVGVHHEIIVDEQTKKVNEMFISILGYGVDDEDGEMKVRRECGV